MIVQVPSNNNNNINNNSNDGSSSASITMINAKIAATNSIALLSSKFRLIVSPAIRDMATLKEAREIGHQYEPSNVDIFCGRGKGFYNRPGNKSFRIMVGSYIPAYLAAKTKVDKSAVLNTIVDKVRALHDPITGRPAQFIKYSKKTGWVEIGDEQAREKVGHAMREAIGSTVEEQQGTGTTGSDVDHQTVGPSTSSSSNGSSSRSKKPINKAKATRKTASVSHKAAGSADGGRPLPLLSPLVPIDSSATIIPSNTSQSSCGSSNYSSVESMNVSSCQQEALMSMMMVDGVDPDEVLDEQSYLNEFARQQPHHQTSSSSSSSTSSSSSSLYEPTSTNNNSSGSTFLWSATRRSGSGGRTSFLSAGRDSMSSEMMRAAIESFIGI